MKSLLAFPLLLCAAVSALSQENYSTWSQHQSLYLNAFTAGATGNVLKFPVLVRLDSTNFKSGFAQSVKRGADLRFTKAGDVIRLPHQIELWDSAHLSAAIWVSVDTVFGGINNQVLRMHWGKSGAVDSSNGKAVFDTAKGFQAVFHFGEATGDTARDATQNGFKALPLDTLSRGVPSDTAGVIGRAKFFNGGASTASGAANTATIGGYFRIQNSASGPLNFPQDGPYTLSAWVNLQASPTQNTYRIILSKGDFQYGLEKNDTTRIGQYEFDPLVLTPIHGWERTLGGTLIQGNWQYLAGVRYANGIDTFFVDGVAMPEPPTMTLSNASRVLTNDLYIGRLGNYTTGNNGNRFWLGSLDEVRLASAARGSNWIKLETANQKPAQTLVTFGAPASISSQSSPDEEDRTGKSFSVKSMGNGGWIFEVPAMDPGIAKAHVSVMDIQGNAVWSQSVALQNGNQIFWSGESHAGQKIVSGIYVARVILLDARSQIVQVLQREIPYSP